MSECIVQVATIDDLKPHPNADKLEIAVVLGWQCIVGKDTWRTGDRCVFFPPDTILPQEVSDGFGVTQYLSKGRVKSTRLRGEPSFGLVVQPDVASWKVGENVAKHYGATKYEPPVREVRGQGNRQGGVRDHPLFSRYTEIENLRNFPHVFTDGEEVVLSEKLHGCNVRVGVVDGQIMAGSRRLSRQKPKNQSSGPSDDAIYWTPYFGYSGVRSFLESFIIPQTWWGRLLRRPRKSRHTVILYGEVFGPSIQSFDYGLHGESLDFRAFDIMIDGKFLDYCEYRECCAFHDIPVVPELYRGSFDLEVVRSLSEGTTTLGGDHMREGVVVRPVAERRDARFGRVIAKYVSDSYLLAKKTDYTEV